MRAVLATLLLAAFGAGCIAAEPGKETENPSQRMACTELEGLTFRGGIDNARLVAFVADDAEYSTYTETSADGTQSMGLAQCIVEGNINVIYIDGATDHYSARAEVPSSSSPATGGVFLQWTDGQTLVSPIER